MYTPVGTLDDSGPENVNYNANFPLLRSATATTSGQSPPINLAASLHLHTNPLSRFYNSSFNLENLLRARRTKTVSSVSISRVARTSIHPPCSLQSSHTLASKHFLSFPCSLFFHLRPLHLSLSLRFYMWRNMQSSIIFCHGRGWHPHVPALIPSTHCSMRCFFLYIIGSKLMRHVPV